MEAKEIENLDLTPTGQSYFDNQRAEHQRIIENGRKLMEEQEKKPNKLTEALDVVLNEVKKLEVNMNENENSALNKSAVMPRFSVSLVYQNVKSIMLRTLILNATDEANALLETMDYFKKEADGMGLVLKAITRINEA